MRLTWVLAWPIPRERRWPDRLSDEATEVYLVNATPAVFMLLSFSNVGLRLKLREAIPRVA